MSEQLFSAFFGGSYVWVDIGILVYEELSKLKV